MKTVKTVVKIFLFLFVLVLVCQREYNVLSWKDSDGILSLYNSKENSIDVLFTGSSHSFCTVNTGILWEEYGIAAKDIADGGQPLASTYYYLKEALKTQHPEIVFVELYGINISYLALTDGNIYRNTLNMKWSLDYLNNRNSVIDAIGSKYKTEENYDDIVKGMLYKFPVIHTRYSELTENDYKQNNEMLRFLSNWTTKAYDKPVFDNSVGTLSEKQISILDDIYNLSREENFKLIFWVAPYVVNEDAAKIYNALEKYADEKNIDMYNFIKLADQINFDFTADMRNESVYGSHVNNFGSMKVTRYLGDLLRSVYGVPDRSADPLYAEYERMGKEWDLIKAQHDLETADNFKDFMTIANNDLFDTTVYFFNYHEAGLNEELISFLNEMKTNEEGLFTNAQYNNISKVWGISDRYKLIVKDHIITLYDGTETVQIPACDAYVITVDKINGKYSKRMAFTFSEDKYIKK